MFNSLALAVVVVVGFASIARAEPLALPDAVRENLQAEVFKKEQPRLKRGVQDYNKHLTDKAYFEQIFKKSGFSEEEIKAIKHRFGRKWEQARLGAVWQGDQAILSSQALTVTVGLEELETNSVRVNDKVFYFDDRKSLVETVDQLQEFFVSVGEVSRRKTVLERVWAYAAGKLITTALADEEFYVETDMLVATLSLHYTVKASEPRGQALVRLNEAIVTELTNCRNNEGQNYSKRHQRLSEILERTEKLTHDFSVQSGSAHPVPLSHHRIAGCPDLFDYWQNSVYPVRADFTEDGKPEFEDRHPEMPRDMCQNLKYLQGCIASHFKTPEQYKELRDENTKQMKKSGEYDPSQDEKNLPESVKKPVR